MSHGAATFTILVTARTAYRADVSHFVGALVARFHGRSSRHISYTNIDWGNGIGRQGCWDDSAYIRTFLQTYCRLAVSPLMCLWHVSGQGISGSLAKACTFLALGQSGGARYIGTQKSMSSRHYRRWKRELFRKRSDELMQSDSLPHTLYI